MQTIDHVADSGDPGGTPPDSRAGNKPRQRLTKLIAAIAAAAAAFTGSIVIAEPAQALSGTAVLDTGIGGISDDTYYWLGTVRVGGTKVFCIDPGSNSPLYGNYQEGAWTNFGWGPDKTARVNYVATTYRNTADVNTAAAAQQVIWQLINPWGWNMHGYSGSNFRDAVYYNTQQIGYLSGQGPFATWRLNEVADKAVAIMAEAMTITAGADKTVYVTGDPTASTGDMAIDVTLAQIEHTDHFTVTIGDGIEAGGSTGTLTLTNATWDATGTATLTGTIHSGDVYPITADHAGPTPITVTGTTSTEIVTQSTATVVTQAQMWIPLVTVLYNQTDASRQNLSWGAGTALYNVTTITTTTNVETRSYHFDAAIDSTIWFAPKVTTSVESEFVTEGDRLVDFVTPVLFDGSASWGRTADGGAWLPVTFQATIYKTAGPVADGEPIPDDAVVVGTASMTTNVAGDPTRVPVEVGGPVVAESGFYVWVWRATLGDQATGTRPYLNPGVYPWTDDARVPETSVAPFQPFAISAVTERLVVPGDAISDQLTVSSSNGVWLEGQGGESIPVTFTGTAYQVAGVLPPTQGAGVPSSAVVLGTVQITAAGPGVYTSPTVAVPNAGFVTWKWEARVAQQPAVYRPYLAGDWIDDFGITAESTSVRHPISITSEVREYNVHSGGRAFDRIVVTGFPADHTAFEGDGYWGADIDEIVHTVYGPLEEDQLTDDLDLANAPVLTTITTAARNGTYQVGYTTADEIRPTEPGYYVVVSSFAGDDRVQPFVSSPADILERFFVPGPPPPPAPTPEPTPTPTETPTPEPTPTPTDTPTPPPPTIPPTDNPPPLAYTGTPDWLLPVGLGSATFLLVLGGMLLFGRRLAMARAVVGEVRDEDWLSVEQIEELLGRPMEDDDIEAVRPPDDEQ